MKLKNSVLSNITKSAGVAGPGDRWLLNLQDLGRFFVLDDPDALCFFGVNGHVKTSEPSSARSALVPLKVCHSVGASAGGGLSDVFDLVGRHVVPLA